MARIIEFFPRQLYMGHANASLAMTSEPFDIGDIETLAVELRVFGTQPVTGLLTTAQIWTTADSTFLDASWKQVSSNMIQVGTGVSLATFSGLQRFVRAKLEVPTTGFSIAYLVAVAREP
jgi:hypothetical protein